MLHRFEFKSSAKFRPTFSHLCNLIFKFEHMELGQQSIFGQQNGRPNFTSFRGFPTADFSAMFTQNIWGGAQDICENDQNIN